ncbi:MAG: OmpH family outer membrane protein [Deltaproteobacteria bacterium]|nr:OmpH family outer membrane protein [Deltaproteobacteria bacterium]
MNFRKNILSVLVVSLAIFIANPCLAAKAVALKIGVVSIQEVIDRSDAGHSARKVLEAKQKELQPKLLKEKKALEQEAKNIEKKGSAWSQEKKQDAEREYQKRAQDYKMKVDDARYTMKQLQKKMLNPIFKRLQGVIKQVGQEEGIAIIFEKSRSNGLLYAAKNLDVTNLVLKKLNSKIVVKK